jgi:hypothetical protein
MSIAVSTFPSLIASAFGHILIGSLAGADS